VYIWGVLALLVNLVVIGTQFYLHPFWQAWDTVTGWYSPWNLEYFVVEIILLSPALVAYWLRQPGLRHAIRRHW